MPLAYSYDLRVRVLSAVDSGEKITEVSKVYKVARFTIYRWLQQRKKTGTIKAKTGWQQGYGHKIKDLSYFKEFALKNQNLTLKEMAELWGNVNYVTIYRALNKINFTRKKRLLVIKKEMSKQG